MCKELVELFRATDMGFHLVPWLVHFLLFLYQSTLIVYLDFETCMTTNKFTQSWTTVKASLFFLASLLPLWKSKQCKKRDNNIRQPLVKSIPQQLFASLDFEKLNHCKVYFSRYLVNFFVSDNVQIASYMQQRHWTYIFMRCHDLKCEDSPVSSWISWIIYHCCCFQFWISHMCV